MIDLAYIVIIKNKNLCKKNMWLL